MEQRGTVFLVAVVCLLIGGICAPFSGHDLQRAMQIAIAACAVLYGLAVTPVERLVDRPTALGLGLIIGLGLVSSALAHQPLWAFTEVAALVVGWLLALHVWRSEPTAALPWAWTAWRILGVLAVGLLIAIAVRDAPHITQAQQQYLKTHDSHLQPRFWAQGVIAR